MIYSCLPCDFETNRKANYERHLTTTSHNNIINDVPEKKETEEDKRYICINCNSEYAYASGLSKHKNNCKKNPELINTIIPAKTQTEILILKQKLEDKNKEIDNKNQIILEQNNKINNLILEKLEQANKELEYYKSQNPQPKEYVKSVKTLTYVKKYFDKTPILIKLNDFSLIRDDDKKETFEEIIIHQNKINNLSQYFAKIVVDLYVKKNKKQQSLFVTDLTRRRFIYRGKRNGKVQWLTDKKASECKKQIIIPMISYVREILNEYLKKMTHEEIPDCEKIVEISTTIEKINGAKFMDFILIEASQHFTLDVTK